MHDDQPNLVLDATELSRRCAIGGNIGLVVVIQHVPLDQVLEIIVPFFFWRQFGQVVGNVEMDNRLPVQVAASFSASPVDLLDQ